VTPLPATSGSDAQDALDAAAAGRAQRHPYPPRASQQEFAPWGKVRSGGVGQTTLNDTGQRLDGTGLLSYHARYDDPGLGRFLSADSVIPDSQNPQAFNRYSYTLNNPVRYIDPSGHCSFDAAGNIDKWDCSVEEFERMSLDERARWVEQFMHQSRCGNCFNNIAGVIDFFRAEGLGTSGSWVSMVDAGILQGMSLGFGTFLNSEGRGPAMQNVNWGAAKWSEFFTYRSSPNPTDLSEQRRLWGEAEQASTNYAVWYAQHGVNPRTGAAYGLGPTIRVAGLYGATEWYRYVVRNGGGDVPISPNPFDPFDPLQRPMVVVMAEIYWQSSKPTCGTICDTVTVPIVP
jgi:RHS repeat-associated protein